VNARDVIALHADWFWQIAYLSFGSVATVGTSIFDNYFPTFMEKKCLCCVARKHSNLYLTEEQIGKLTTINIWV
jgi:hypothetical protein